ncbi:MAG: hypothetical protein ACJA13_003473 [Paraglaciecola sp.]
MRVFLAILQWRLSLPVTDQSLPNKAPRFCKANLLSVWVDILALNTFSYLVALPVELGIAGMSFDEHIQVRIVALLLNTLVALPFSLWRNFIVRSTGLHHDSSRLKTYLVDSLIFFSFQLPLYVGNLILGGADFIEIVKATVTVSLIAGTLGRPYGIYLDWIRVRHGLKHTLDH